MKNSTVFSTMRERERGMQREREGERNPVVGKRPRTKEGLRKTVIK